LLNLHSSRWFINIELPAWPNLAKVVPHILVENHLANRHLANIQFGYPMIVIHRHDPVIKSLFAKFVSTNNVSRLNVCRPNDVPPPRHYGLTETTCLNKYPSYLNKPKVQDKMVKTCTLIKLAIFLKKKCISL
jgi:hypothetical protein